MPGRIEVAVGDEAQLDLDSLRRDQRQRVLD